MINIGITGGETIIAGELIRLLINHPDANVKWVSSHSEHGKLSRMHKGLIGECDLEFSEPLIDEVDLIFNCDSYDSPLCDMALANNETLRVIELSRSYGFVEGRGMYGLSEINRKFMVHDCFGYVLIPSAEAMAVLLALVPLAKNKMLNGDVDITVYFNNCFNNDINVNSIKQEIFDVIKALDYNFTGRINIKQESGTTTRSLLANVEVASQADIDSVKDLYNEYYDDHSFTFVVNQKVDETDVINTNKCLLNFASNDGKLIITSVIDALLKGSAGNAVHIMNLLFGLHEKVGLVLKAQVF
ncbi:MAG: N-acetyl-gamma-glutamyl-phosphate reductase [Muribaculaceae bacterium]|nr:N-acetyl-gamma-glutamyl-phosphate reductase [Muribaculaceae bacterium]